jgi:hypothetical protein
MCMLAPASPSDGGNKVIKASDFCYRKGQFPWLKGNAREVACYNVWRHIRGPFLLPKGICTHDGKTFCGSAECLWAPAGSPRSQGTIYSRTSAPSFCRASYESSWDPFDFNLAGCLMCGAFHVCFDGVCPVEISREGHSVCMITGMCVKMLSFSSDEFLDTIHVVDEPVCPFSTGQPGKHLAWKGLGGEGGNVGKKRAREGGDDAVVASGATATHKKASPSSPPPRSTLMPPSHQSPFAFSGASSSSSCSSAVVQCRVNKKNRYRSWVYHRVTQPKGASIMPGRSAAAPSAFEATIVSPAAPSLQTHSDHMHSLIHSFVHDVLCSSKWEKSICMERQKASAKKKQQHLHDQQQQQAGPAHPSYCKLVRQSFNAGRMANAHMATKAERQRICEWCVDTIHRHMCLMNAMCKGVITEAKLRSAAVGLLYMLRQGIIVHELVVLPRLKRLEDILPLENHLDVLFGVRAKCITETENVVKIILRSVTKQQLLDAGVSEVSCRLS